MTGGKAPILVAGATGEHGGTGGRLVRRLRAAALPVRALARTDDHRTAALRALGAEVFLGDLHDMRTLAPALAGVEAAYFTYPVAAGIADAAANFAAAARGAGVARIVVMSMAVARPDSPSPLGRAQWLAEEVLEWAGLSVIRLRIAALFFENIALLHGCDIADDGVLRNAFADVAFSWMSGDDAAALACAALLHPERFAGTPTVYPSGAELLSHGQIAAALGTRIGRALRHETVGPEEWKAILLARAGADRRISAAMADHIVAVASALRRPGAINGLFAALTGERPRTLQEALAEGLLTNETRAA